jgi:hypothetical protein
VPRCGYRRYSKDNPAANRMLTTIRAMSTARSRMELAVGQDRDEKARLVHSGQRGSMSAPF